MTELDPVIHAPNRLRVMSILNTTDAVEFAFLRDQLDLSMSSLSKHMKALEEAGYLTVSKSGRGPGSRTWYRLTRAGRDAYARYLEALREILGPAV